MESRDLIIGAGPAGLTAGEALCRGGRRPLIVEATGQVGGTAGTEVHDGYRFDIGGHRFFTKVPAVEALWKRVIGTDFIQVPRRSRIYMRGQFYNCPLQLFSALGNLGPVESTRILLSYFKWKVLPSRTEDNFGQWVSNRFGVGCSGTSSGRTPRRSGASRAPRSARTGRRSGSRTGR
ncbi:MAG: NAD(P)-binding protein [Planctomycetota bacterium]